MAKAKDIAAADDAAEEKPTKWLTPERYRRIGKYMKPWGKPPTGVTFWVQLLTTLAVIIISIFKGVDASVELVVSFGPPEFQNQQQQSPQNLAIGVVFLLTCFVLICGYAFNWYQERALKAEKAAAKQAKAAALEEEKAAAAERAKPPAKTPAPAPKSAESSAATAAPTASKAAAAPPQPAPPAGGSNKAKSKEAGKAAAEDEDAASRLERDAQQELAAALQKVHEDGVSQGLSADVIQRQLDEVRMSHAQHMQAQKEIMVKAEEVRARSLAAGVPEEEANRRAMACAQWHQQIQQIQQKHYQMERRVQREAEKAGLPHGEVIARVAATRRVHAAEVDARREHAQACTTAEQEATKEGKSPPEIMQRVQACARAQEEKWNEKRKALLMAEEARGKAATEVLKQSEDATIDHAVREMLRATAHELAKVGISGLAGRPELNGLRGTITGYSKEKGRLAVAVVRAPDVPPEHVLLKPANLTVVSKVNAEGEEVDVDDDDSPPPLE